MAVCRLDLPDAAIAAVLAAPGFRAQDRYALSLTCQALRDAVGRAAGVRAVVCLQPGEAPGAAPQRLAAMMGRFRRAKEIAFAYSFEEEAHGERQWFQLEAAQQLLQLLGRGTAGEPPPPRWDTVEVLYGCPASCAAELVERCPNIKMAVVLVDGPKLPTAGAAALAGLTQLHSLDILAPTARDDDLPPGKRLAAGKPRETCGLRAAWLALRGLTNLRRLYFYCSWEPERNGEQWRDCIDNLTKLKSLKLWCGLSGVYVPSQLSKLQQLVLHGDCTGDGTGYSYVARDAEAFRGDGDPPPSHLHYQLKLLSLASLGALTQLDLVLGGGSPELRLEHPLDFSSLHVATALQTLSLGSAPLWQDEMESLAAACPQLKRLEVGTLCADETCSAVLVRLTHLTAGFDMDNSYPVYNLAPKLDSLALRACPDGRHSLGFPPANRRSLRIALLLPLIQQHYGPGNYLLREVVGSAQGAVQALMFKSTDAELLFSLSSGTPIVPTLRFEGSTVFTDVALAAARFRGVTRLNIVFKPRFRAVCDVQGTIAAALAFRNLQSMTLHFPCYYWLDQPEQDWDGLLDQIEAGRPKGLKRVVMYYAWGVTHEAVARAERRAAERGWPLTVKLRFLYEMRRVAVN